MSDELVIHEGTEAITRSDWGRVQHWIGMAARFGRCSIACQVMAGFELLELHERHRIKAGQPKKELFHSEIILFKDLIKKELSISNATGWRWMRMAELFVAKYGKLNAPERLRTLLAVSPQAWSNEDTNFIINFLDEVTEGKSQREFMMDLGLRKKPKAVGQGGESNKMAGSEGKGAEKTQATEGVDDAKLALREWREVEERMERYGMKFVALEGNVVAEQILAAVRWLELRREWLEAVDSGRLEDGGPDTGAVE